MSDQTSPISSASLQQAEDAKAKNIIEMGLDFTAMKWLFQKESTPKILDRLETAFAKFHRIESQNDYDRLHEDFCNWFTENVPRAQKKKQREAGAPIKKSSYGQAAKVMDIAAKVYVYYCNMPSPEIARVIVPILHGALDNEIVQHLIRKFPGAGVKSEALEDIDCNKYQQLQSLVAKDVQEISIRRSTVSNMTTSCSVGLIVSYGARFGISPRRRCATNRALRELRFRRELRTRPPQSGCNVDRSGRCCTPRSAPLRLC
jgi:hypothetical protein